MNISNKLIDILQLQAIAVTVKSAYKNIQKVFDAGHASGYEEGVKVDPQWNAYCLKTGEHFDLPEGMTEIPYSMFRDHTDLRSVSIPDTVTTIGAVAFKRTRIGDIQLPKNVEFIGDGAFESCKNISAFVFSPNIIETDGPIFDNAPSLASITFVKTSSKDGTIITGTPSYLDLGVHDGTYENEYGELEEYDPHTDIYVPWGEDDPINDGAPWGFEYATIHYKFWDNIPDVFHFPKGFVKIPDYLFYESTVTNAKEIYLGDECKEIGACAFYKAKNLETVNLPEGLTTIGDYAFRYCSALKLSELPDSVEEIGNRAFHGSSVSLSKLPKNIKRIEINAFQNCPNNTFTEIPESITLISSGAFLNNTGLTKLSFVGTPMVKKVTNGIANNAFSGCTNLVEINVPWSEGEVSGAPWGAENAQINYDTLYFEITIPGWGQ